MAGTESQYHILRITIQIRRVNMAVRFPCSLQFQLKNEANIVESRLAYELKDGKCEPNQKLITDLEIQAKDAAYPEKKVNLIVLMASSNGKIPAGSVSLKVAEKGKLAEHPGSQNLTIEKCPDKAATIELNIKIQYIRSFRKDAAGGQSHRSKLYSSPSQNIYDRIHLKDMKKIVTPQKYKNKANFEKMLSESDSPKGVFSKGKIQDSNSGSQSIIQEQLLFNEPQAYYQQKILKISKEKDNYAKQVSLLKAEVHTLRREEQWRNGSNQDQISKYRTQIDSLTQELTNAKDRLKTSERKEKQVNNQNRDFKEQIQKNRVKMTTLETTLEQTKAHLHQKQRHLKRLTQQVKQLKETLEDTKLIVNTQQKRIDYKETTYKEQMTKLTQKLQLSESERQKATLQLNNMLNQFQNSEKKAQLQTKEKERAHQDERNRLNKKIDGLAVQIKQLREANQELETGLAEFKSLNSSLGSQKQQLSLQLKDLLSKHQTLSSTSRKQENTILILNAQIVELEQIKKQYTQLNKKHVELTTENGKNGEQLARALQKIQSLTRTIKDLEGTVKDTSGQRDAGNVKIGQLNKQIQKIKKILETKESEITSLQQNISSVSSKLSQAKMKSDSDRMEAENLRNKSEAQIIYLLRTKDQLLSQLQQLRWKLTRTEETGNSLTQKISSLNQKILKVSEQLMNEQEKVSSLREQLKENENKIEGMAGQLLAKEGKEKELQNAIRVKNQQEFELKKIIKEKEQEIFILKQKEKQNQLQSKEKISLLEISIKERQQSIEKISKQLLIIKGQKADSLKNIESLNTKVSKYMEETQNVRGEGDEMRKYIASLESELAAKDRKISQLQANIASSNKKQQELLVSLAKKEEMSTKLKQEWQQYRADTCRAIQQFMVQINRDNITSLGQQQQPVKETTRTSTNTTPFSPTRTTTTTTTITKTTSELLAFPDNNLSLLQIQSLKKRQDQLYKAKQKMEQYEGEIAMLSIELNRWKQNAKDREEELENAILLEKERIKLMISDNLTERNAMMEKMSAYEEKLHEVSSELEKTSLELARTKQQYQQLSQQLQDNKTQQQKQQQKIKALNKTIQSINNTQIQYRSTNESQVHTLAQESRTQIERLKNINKDLEKKISKHNITMQEMEEYGRKLEGELSELHHAKDKLEKKLEFSEAKANDIIQQRKKLEGELYQADKRFTEQVAENDKTKQLLAAQKYKNSELAIKMNKVIEDVERLEQQKGQMEKQIEEMTNNIVEADVSIRKSQTTSQNQLQKMNEIIKQLREKIITLNSEVDLKNFLNSQLENSNSQLKSQSQQQIKQLAQKRTLMIQLQQKLQNSKNEIIFLHQNYENLSRDKEAVDLEYKKQKQLVEVMTNTTMEQSVLGELLATKERQCVRLREEYESLQGKFQYNAKEYKQSLADLRKELSVKSAKQEQLKRKIRELEKQVSQKSHELLSRAQKNRDDSDRQRLELIRSLDLLQSQNNRLKSQCEYLRQQFSRQLEQVNQECAQLTRLLTQRQQMLVTKGEQVKQNEKKVRMLSNELKNCLEAWEREKTELRVRDGSAIGGVSQMGQLSSKFQRLIDDVEGRSRNLHGRK